ncbi:MAG: ribosome small subunit-dependent GTPase A [Gemmatimonadota bacterium]
MIARVLQGSGGTYRVRAGGRDLECSLRGRVKRGDAGAVAVGDRVEIEELDDGSCRITEILPRVRILSRRSMARRRDQIMAANLDQLAIVVSVARPAPDLHMLDRLLAVAELNELDPFIICNKTDLSESSPAELDVYADLGYDVLPTSVPAARGLTVLRERLAGRTTVLAGSSGVGKSSLLNALVPGLELRVGDVGERKGRGRHTTSSAQLIPIDDDTYIADTPGIQHFVPTGVGVDALGHAFPDLRPFADDCRFADCRHRAEPGCAVRKALANGLVDSRRYESYLDVLAEAESAESATRRGGDG